MPTLNLGRVGFVNKGTWLISTAYKINDTVTYLGGTYACLIANTGQTPILGGTIYWQEWVANDVVHKSGDESIGGVKTFTSSPIVPDAITSGQAVNKGQLDLKANLASPALTGTPTINGSRALSVNTTAYDNDLTAFIANTLASGAIIERGSNANGSYIKFADGTLICTYNATVTDQAITTAYGTLFNGTRTWTFPSAFINPPSASAQGKWSIQASWNTTGAATTTAVIIYFIDIASRATGSSTALNFIAIGRWK